MVMTFEVTPVGAGGSTPAIEPIRKRFLDVGAVRVESLVAPPDSEHRQAGIVEAVTLAVTVVGTVAQLIDTCRGILSERRSNEVDKIIVVLDGDEVEVTDPATKSEDEKLSNFIRRHDRS